MSGYLPPVVVEVEGHDAKLLQTLRDAKASVRKFAVDVDKMKASVRLDADTSRLDAKIQRMKAQQIGIKVKLDLASGEAQRVNAYLDAFKEPIKVLVKPTLDVPAARRVAFLLDSFKEPIAASIRPEVNEPSVLRSRQRLDQLTRDRIVSIRARVSGGSGSFGSGGGGGVDWLSTLISLAPALTPIAASLGSVALSASAASVAIGAFGAAAIPQIAQFKDLTDAQKKATTAIGKYGAVSKQAAQAQDAVASALDSMTPATRQAAGAFLVLKEHFKDWSDNLSQFTMVPITRSMGVIDALLPKLSPLVQETSLQFARLVTVLGGGINSNAFDSLMSRFTAFTSGVLQRGVNGVIHFARVLSEGNGNGPIRQFLDYAHQVGPQVRDTLKNLAEAVGTIMRASAQAGPGLLALVNSVAKLVASLPPAFLAHVMQVYTAFKLLSLTRVGIVGVAGSFASLSTRLGTLLTAAQGAGGGIRGLARAMSYAQRSTAALGVLGLVAVGISKLADKAKGAPPDIDRLTTSLKNLADTGKFTGELQKTFGDVNGLVDKIGKLQSQADKMKQTAYGIRVPVLDDVADWLAGKANDMQRGHESLSALKADFSSLDQGLASLVSSGHADAAAKDFDAIKAAALKGGYSIKDVNALLPQYQSALADANAEQKLTAQSMGLFGAQAAAVQRKLDAQKQAAQGLQQAILDLNDANRAGLDAESAYQQAIDDATKAIKGHHNALKMAHGQLDLNTQAARDAYGPLSQMASTAEALSMATLKQTGSQDKANRVLIDAHANLVRVAKQMGLNSADANRLADSLDNIKDPKIQVTVSTMKAESDLAAAKKRVDAFPKTAPTKATFAYKQAMSDLQFYQRMVDQLHGKTVTVQINGVMTGVNAAQYYSQGPHADGGLYSGGTRRMAAGGMGRPAMMAKGGSSILWAEAGDESYIPHDRRPRSRRILEQTAAIMGGRVSWGGAFGAQVAAGLGVGMAGQTGALATQARTLALAGVARPIAEALEIASPSKVTIRFGRWVSHGLVQGLTGTTSQVKAAAKKVGDTVATTFGSHSHLSKLVDADNRRLLRLAAQRDSVAKRLKAAQKHLADLRKSWSDKRSEIASGIMSGVSVITGANETGRPVNAQDVLANLKRQAQKAIQFAGLLKQLRSKGLRSDLIQQLAAAGPEQGYDTALALAGGSSGQIKQVNSTQKSLVSAANSTGSVVANAMYGAGIKSAQGLVKGLASQEKAIERQMMRIAKAMEAAIKKALGIRSPSRVFAEIGTRLPQGLAAGITTDAKKAVIAARGLAMSTAHAATAGSGRLALSSALAATATSSGAPVVNNYITVQGSVLSERELRKVIEEQTLRLGMRNSGTYIQYQR